jgi:hypothetical protein
LTQKCYALLCGLLKIENVFTSNSRTVRDIFKNSDGFYLCKNPFKNQEALFKKSKTNTVNFSVQGQNFENEKSGIQK